MPMHTHVSTHTPTRTHTRAHTDLHAQRHMPGVTCGRVPGPADWCPAWGGGPWCGGLGPPCRGRRRLALSTHGLCALREPGPPSPSPLPAGGRRRRGARPPRPGDKGPFHATSQLHLLWSPVERQPLSWAECPPRADAADKPQEMAAGSWGPRSCVTTTGAPGPLVAQGLGPFITVSLGLVPRPSAESVSPDWVSGLEMAPLGPPEPVTGPGPAWPWGVTLPASSPPRPTLHAPHAHTAAAVTEGRGPAAFLALSGAASQGPGPWPGHLLLARL